MKSILKFLPLLLLYVLLVLLFAKDGLYADEVRYHMFAENLLNGFYTQADNPNLMNGPGYPIYLAIFMALGLPLIVPKFVHAFLAFFAVIFLYKSLLYYLPKKTATFYAYILGLYVPMIGWISFLFSDILCLFLVSAFIYFTIKCLRSEKFRFKNTLLPAFLMSSLILSKVFFALVVTTAIIMAIGYYIFVRDRKVLQFMLILGLGYIAASPYLGYTYSMTGRFPYWSSNGGEQLYWMSSHHEYEYGNWIESTHILERDIPNLHPDHPSLYDSAYTKPWVERNDIFLEEAKKNIKKDPLGYVYNVVANSLRLLADSPNSYHRESLKPFLFLFFNIILLVPFVLSIIPAWLNRKSIPFEIMGLSFFILIYLGGSIFIAAIQRYFIITVPFLLLWTAFINTNFVQLSFANQSKNKPKTQNPTHSS